MDYKKIYYQIIDRAKNRELVSYRERHHIIPKCIGGGDEKENLVYLTAREHYLCHQLLCELYPKEKKLFFAFWAMSNQLKNKNQKRDYIISSRLYERLKQTIKHTEETKKKLRKPKPQDFGSKISKSLLGVKHNPDRINKQRQSLMESIKNNQGKGFNLGSSWNENSKKTHSEKRKGEGNPRYGSKLTDEHKKILLLSQIKNKKIIGQYTLEGELVKIWSCGGDISKELGISRDGIINCCKGRRKTFKNYIWRYEKN